MIFANDEHEKAFKNYRTSNDCMASNLQAFIYCLCIDQEVMNVIEQIFNFDSGQVNRNIYAAAWNSSGTSIIIKLAIALLEAENTKEYGQLDIEDLFCHKYTPYFIQAIKIRFPEHTKKIILEKNSRRAGRKAIFSSADIEAMKKLREAGRTYKEIAVKYRTSEQMVHKHINK